MHGHQSSINSTPSDPDSNQDQNAYSKRGQKFDPNRYCSFHWYKVEELHTSSTCRFLKNGHNKLVTRLYIKVGKTWNKECINGVPTKWGGAGLDKYIVNINEDYINYIQSNPKLVQTVDNLSVAYTGTTGHYLTLDSPCDNKQQAVHLIPIQIPNREIITSTHTALLSHQDLPIQARESHHFPGINKALLSCQ